MAVDPKILQKFLSNPANVKLDDIEDPEAVPVEAESPFPEADGIPAEDMEEDVEAPELMAEDKEDLDPELKMKLAKLQRGIPSEMEADDSEVAADPSMDPQMRKMAMQKIKEKYLGKQ